MQRRYADFLRCIIGLSCGILLPYASVSVAATCETGAAKVVAVQGTVEAQRQGEMQWQAVKFNDTYCPGDTLRVQEKSRADVALANQSVLRLNANTTMTLEGVKAERTSVIGLLKGAAHFFSRGPRNLEVHTPFVAAGIRGTEFLVQVEATQTLLSVFTGSVLASNEAGSLTLGGGQSSVTEAGKAPSLRVVARPRDAVQWALYYPPVLYVPAHTSQAAPDWQHLVQTSTAFYLRGEIQQAFASLANVPSDIREPRFFAYRASLLLAVGRVDEARADIQQALRLDANTSEALALQTIIAVVQNEPDRALQIARQAVQARPQSATAHIALSYAQQAKFDLTGARSSLQTAVQAEPKNALAWARLAELHASFSELDRALSAAQQAVALEPELARTQTVLGFAYLIQTRIRQAQAAFLKAQTLDQADPLPRLGLGLAKIREGHEQEGIRDIEIAASLDPNNALVRSYLGKAYYEEKRSPLDEREYRVAQELDPRDPTPLFYEAIAKQTTNRPVEALHDVQKAIALNDNRAVYRSRLTLDSDLAARSAGQARIYSDLGFQQLALVEGWKSVNTDPSNFSAHRFLADSYSVLPRHEIARVSELLQSQLLQPINLTPIQPRLAESNLFLISAGGPGALSFNEFNPIFNRDGVTLQTSGLAGEHSTWAGEGVVAGIYKQFSFSIGSSYFTTDGWRPNADQKDLIGNAFLQIELSPQTSLQGEYRYRDREHGDLQQRFFPEAFLPGLTDAQQRHTVRLGGRHAFTPGSIALASLTYQKSDTRVTTDEFAGPDTFIDSKLPEESYGVELQHLFRSQHLNLTSGAGYFNVDGEIRSSIGLMDLVTALPPIPTKFNHVNLYAYAYLNLLQGVTITAGASYDHLNGDLPGDGESQFNPKFGITWNPFLNTTVRLAAFRTLKRTLITDQTLEPTQVAGFNQFFDDINLTEAWRYGGAIDQKFARDLYGGVEFSKRDLTVPFIDLNAVTQEASWDEILGRVYLFWAPHRWLALKAQYVFERFEREDQLTFGFKELETHRIPLGISVFHPSGLATSLTATYWHQVGQFEGLAEPVFRSGRDDFWLFDAALNYRLPKRYGFITVGATNLFDKNFKYFETDFDNPTIQPSRTFYARISLTFP